jgi:transposase
VSDGMASGGRDAGVVTHAPFVMGEAPGAIVAGFDVHRRQITVDALDTTGEVYRGQIESTPAAVEEWVARFPGRVVHVAVEACTGWLLVCRALERRGAVVHLAEPVETSALRGRKRRAKTDRADARWLRQLLCEGRLPEAWLPPEHVRQWRSRARLRNTLVDERTSWTQRIRATLYHHGVAGAPDELRTLAGRQFLARLELPVDARERITTALEIIDLLDAQLAELERDLRALARRQAGCQALMAQYGMGEIWPWSRCASSGRSQDCTPPARRSGWPASTSACTAPTATPSWESSPVKAPPRCAGPYTRLPNRLATAAVLTTTTITPSRPAGSPTPARR